LIFETIDDSAS